MAVIKKIIKVNNLAKDVLCLQYITTKGKITLGGPNKLQERMYDVYLSVFGECDGEPQFYNIVHGKCRLDFRMTMKQFLGAVEKIKKDDKRFNGIEEAESFGRLM